MNLYDFLSDDYPPVELWQKMMKEELREEKKDPEQQQYNNTIIPYNNAPIPTLSNSIPLSSVIEGFVMVDPNTYNCPVHGNCSFTGFINPKEELANTKPITKVSSDDTIIDDIKESGDNNTDEEDSQENDVLEVNVDIEVFYEAIRPSLFFTQVKISDEPNNNELNSKMARHIIPTIENSFSDRGNFVILAINNHVYSVFANNKLCDFFHLTEEHLNFFLRKEFSLPDETI